MFDGTLCQIHEAYTCLQNHQQGEGAWATRTAFKLYCEIHNRSVVAKVWAVLTRRPCVLLDLDMVRACCTVRGAYYDGLQSVPIHRILGSEGRCQDFDGAFRPLRSHNKERWVRIAVTQLMRIPLPPVTLTLVGDRYFVLDGHHRISVAKALGQVQIDAEVTVCQFAGRLPWEQALPAHHLAHQSA